MCQLVSDESESPLTSSSLSTAGAPTRAPQTATRPPSSELFIPCTEIQATRRINDSICDSFGEIQKYGFAVLSLLKKYEKSLPHETELSNMQIYPFPSS